MNGEEICWSEFEEEEGERLRKGVTGKKGKASADTFLGEKDDVVLL